MKKNTKKISSWIAMAFSVILAVQPLSVLADSDTSEIDVAETNLVDVPSPELTVVNSDYGTVNMLNFGEDQIIDQDEYSTTYKVNTGEKVEFSVSPLEGYTISEVELQDDQKQNIDFAKKENEEAAYSFEMPENNVQLDVRYEVLDKENKDNQEVSSEEEEKDKTLEESVIVDKEKANESSVVETDEGALLSASLLSGAARAGATITYLGPVTYRGVSVGKFLVNGSLAFCMEHKKTSPPTGTSFSEQIYNDANIRKVLYYGYNGPKQWSGFSGDESQGIVVTTNALSYFYSGPSSLNGNPFLADNWLAPLGDFIKYIQSAPDVEKTDLSLSKSYTESYLSADKKYQRTENITLNASAQNSITIPLPADVSLVNVSDGSEKTGNVQVKGGQTFYLKAPLKMNGTWSSGNLFGSMGKFQPVLCVTSSSSLQNLGQGRYGATDPDHYVNLSVKWVQMGDIRIVKFLEGDAEIKKPAVGAEFTLTHKETGEKVIITADENGVATTEDKVNYPNGRLIGGEWTVEETKTPEGFKTIDPFTVTISGQGQVFSYIAEDKKITAAIRVVKIDKNTGNVIKASGATFKIVDAKGNDVEFTDYSPKKVTFTEFTTDENGQFTLPERLPVGKYKLVEVKAPQNYLVCDPIEFEVDKAYDWENPIVITAEDENVMGKLQLIKSDEETGEPVEGAEFNIIAAEDIVTGDGSLQAAKGDVVDTITTGKDGIAESKKLYLGSYIAKEVKAPSGYVLNQEEYAFELTYKDQNTKIVYSDLEVKNKPTTIIVTKKVKGKDKVLEGVKYNIWNVGMESDVDPNFAFKETYTTDENGQIKLQYLEPGVYKLQEKETLPGYVLDDTEYQFTVDENGMIKLDETADPQEKGSMTLENDYTKLQISKQDATTGKELPGAELELKNKDTGKIIEKWTSGEEPHYIEEIPEGTYILKETMAPKGYKVSQDVEFTVKSTGEVQKVVMKDEVKDGTIRTSMPKNTKNGSATKGRVKTGDNVSIVKYIVLLIAAIGTMIAVWKKKRSKIHA